MVLFSRYLGVLEGKGPFGRPRHRWDDDMNMNLKEVGWGMRQSLD
jgi:hypothetical protein